MAGCDCVEREVHRKAGRSSEAVPILERAIAQSKCDQPRERLIDLISTPASLKIRMT